MSLQWQLSRDIPADTAAVGRVILSQDNAYRQIGDRFDQLLPQESVFTPMYANTGRGAISPLLLALVTVFQMLEKVPDRVAAEMVRTRIDWKYALHLPLLYKGFHFTDLYAFRVRLLEHGQERLVFDQILARLKALGLIKPRGKMRTDSTHILAVVQRLTQLELVTESLRVALCAALEVAPVWCKQALPATFEEAYNQRQWQYGLSDSQVKSRLAQAGRDGFWFLAQIDQSAPEVVRQLPEVETLRTVLRQQFTQGPDGPPAKRPTGRDVIESPHETEARYAKKRGQGWIGYKVQVTETCDDDRPHLIVDLEPTGALANDSPELPHIQARLEKQGTPPGEQYVDQGYMSAEHLVQSAAQGIRLMGIPLDDTQGRQGFRQADFRIDEGNQQAICPAGQSSTVWSQRSRCGAGPPAILVRFDAQTCQRCEFFGQCTTSPQGRSLTLNPYRAALQARRAEAKTEAFQKQLHLRAGVEATISELVRGHQLRSARYRRQAKLRLQTYFTAAAVNLKRTIRWLSQPVQAAKLLSILLLKCKNLQNLTGPPGQRRGTSPPVVLSASRALDRANSSS
jgi:transposase